MRVPLSVIAAIIAGCATQPTIVIGKVVDTRGRSVPQALVAVMRRHAQPTPSGAERADIEQLQTDEHGEFSCVTTEKISDLMIRVDSPDMKRSGILSQLSNGSNIIVIR